MVMFYVAKMFSRKKQTIVNPMDFHTNILGEADAEEFVAKHYSPTLSTREGFINFSIGYFDELGYIPIPLLKYIYDNLK